MPPATIDVGAARVAWDAIEVDPGDFAGASTPDVNVPVRVGFNVLTADASEVDLRFTAELKSARTGVVAWQYEQRAVVASDAPEPTAWLLNVPAPPTEGLYALEIRASWEPSGSGEGSRIGRLLRRRKPTASASGSASRRVTLAVVDPKAKPMPPKPPRGAAEDSVDALDLSRPRGHRPSASGRAAGSGESWRIPDAAVVEETRRDRLRGWISRDDDPVVLAAGRRLGPGLVGRRPEGPPPRPAAPADRRGRRRPPLGPGRRPRRARAARRGKPRVVLDACASGPPLIEGAGPATFSWLVWPDAAEPVLVLVNRGTSSDRPARRDHARRAGRRPRGPGDRRADRRRAHASGST